MKGTSNIERQEEKRVRRDQMFYALELGGATYKMSGLALMPSINE